MQKVYKTVHKLGREVMGALEGVGSGFNQNTLDSGVKFSNNNKDTLHTYMKNFKD